MTATHHSHWTPTLFCCSAPALGSVFMARGNHEDVSMNRGSFADELAAKFPGRAAGAAVRHAVRRVYESLPRALYLGVRQPAAGEAAGEAAAEPAGEGGRASASPAEGIRVGKVGAAGAGVAARHLQGVHGGLEVLLAPTAVHCY